MARIQEKGSKISEKHFSFLLSSEDHEGKHGPSRMKLTTAEAERFVQMTNGMINCLTWDKATDKDVFIKVSKIINKARLSAVDVCEDLPFKW
tara:strand:- start:290 stop:565 length:276 start_codon:yes stop_codon:yes gene_type:complete